MSGLRWGTSGWSLPHCPDAPRGWAVGSAKGLRPQAFATPSDAIPTATIEVLVAGLEVAEVETPGAGARAHGT